METQQTTFISSASFGKRMEYAVVTSLNLTGEENIEKSGKHKDKISVNFANKLVSKKWNPRPKFGKYQGNFDSVFYKKISDHV